MARICLITKWETTFNKLVAICHFHLDLEWVLIFHLKEVNNNSNNHTRITRWVLTVTSSRTFTKLISLILVILIQICISSKIRTITTHNLICKTDLVASINSNNSREVAFLKTIKVTSLEVVWVLECMALMTIMVFTRDSNKWKAIKATYKVWDMDKS